MKRNYEEILQECLVRVVEQDESLQKVLGDYPDWAERLTGELEIAQQMRNKQKSFDPRPGVLISTRQELLKKLEKPWERKFRRLSFQTPQLISISRVFFAAIILIVVFIGGGALTLAIRDALPGSVLFPVRTGVESFQLVLTIDESREAEIRLELAQAYLVDYAVLTSRGNWKDASLVLQQYDRHISRTSRILKDLSVTKDKDYNALIDLFNRIYLGDLTIFPVLSSDA